MKRIYACIVIVTALLAVSFYSSFQVQRFASGVSAELEITVEAIRNNDLATARQELMKAANRCKQMRQRTNHLLRTEDFTELEAALRAADSHLEMQATEEALGEVRRAQVQIETLAWLAHRLV